MSKCQNANHLTWRSGSGYALGAASFHIPENTTAVGHANYSNYGLAPGGGFSILSGEDGAQFTIDPATGDLTFLTAPDFESPTDADANNSYVVHIQVPLASGTLASQDLWVFVQNVDESSGSGSGSLRWTPCAGQIRG